MSTSDSATNNNSKFVRAVEEAFFLLDRNANRSVGTDDFCAVAKSIGMDLDANEVLSLIRTAIREQTDDNEHDTTLTVDEFSTLMLRHVGPSELNDELRLTFEAFDRDHDGRISQHDLDHLRYEHHFFEHLNDEQYEMIVKELILCQNGNKENGQQNGIDFNQFVALMMHQ